MVMHPLPILKIHKTVLFNDLYPGLGHYLRQGAILWLTCASLNILLRKKGKIVNIFSLRKHF